MYPTQFTANYSRLRQWDQTFAPSMSFKHPSCSSSVNSCLSFHLLVTSLTLWLLDLQIYAVTPVSDISDVPQLERVPERIKSFYRINNVSRFHYDRPFHKGPKDRENEFRVRWACSATQSVSASVFYNMEILNPDVTLLMHWFLFSAAQWSPHKLSDQFHLHNPKAEIYEAHMQPMGANINQN